jgi:hypothetical protein
MNSKTENNSRGVSDKKDFTLPNGMVIYSEDIEFLKIIREINFGEIKEVKIVNGRATHLKEPMKSRKTGD